MSDTQSVDNQVEISAPHIYLVRMALFLALAGFVAFILQDQVKIAFMANPGLNGLILGVLAVGIVLALTAVVRLFGEARWVNAWVRGEANPEAPRLLSPMARLLERGGARMSTITLRAILDSVGARLDESRETLRYLTGLLILLGLLGTFWGLLDTVGSIGDVIKAMQGGGDSAAMFDDLKSGIAKPLAGMTLSFTASLFGLAGSLTLGFLDLQAGQALSRFYAELEDMLAARADDSASGLPALDLRAPPTLGEGPSGRASVAALANLAEGVQALVQHMRQEQQMIRTWVEHQAEQNKDIKRVLEKLAHDDKERR